MTAFVICVGSSLLSITTDVTNVREWHKKPEKCSIYRFDVGYLKQLMVT